MQQAPPDDTADTTDTADATEPTDPLPSRECGWFGSSLELREGLEVMELPVAQLAIAWHPREVQPAGCADGCACHATA